MDALQSGDFLSCGKANLWPADKGAARKRRPMPEQMTSASSEDGLKFLGKNFQIYCKLPLAFLGVGYYIDFISTQSQ
jgi:hypothetical protein